MKTTEDYTDGQTTRENAESALSYPSRGIAKPSTRMRGIGWALLDVADAIREHAAAVEGAARRPAPLRGRRR